jgi:hypothetical protein
MQDGLTDERGSVDVGLGAAIRLPEEAILLAGQCKVHRERWQSILFC